MNNTAVPLLEVIHLSARYGSIEALLDASFSLFEGEFIAVLGPNGAGKSTLLKAIMRLIPSQGVVRIGGTSLASQPTDQLSSFGIAFVPEGRGILGPMTVRENLELGAYARRKNLSRGNVAKSLSEIFDVFPRMRERQGQLAGSLSGGEQQILAIGRAMMSAPRLLILDEPSLGLAPRMATEVFKALERLNRGGLSILVVEQKAPLALKLATKAHVMRGGRLVSSIAPETVSAREELAAHYLGRDN